jgi:hypothetical protein
MPNASHHSCVLWPRGHMLSDTAAAPAAAGCRWHGSRWLLLLLAAIVPSPIQISPMGRLEALFN